MERVDGQVAHIGQHAVAQPLAPHITGDLTVVLAQVGRVGAFGIEDEGVQVSVVGDVIGALAGRPGRHLRVQILAQHETQHLLQELTQQAVHQANLVAVLALNVSQIISGPVVAVGSPVDVVQDIDGLFYNLQIIGHTVLFFHNGC